MLNEEELKDAALLVFANKQDQPGAKGAGEISEALRLGELRDRNWSIMACSAVDGSGVTEGMDWLVVGFLGSLRLQIWLLTVAFPVNRVPGVRSIEVSIFPPHLSISKLVQQKNDMMILAPLASG